MKTLHRQILSLALPNIVANLSVPLLGLVDTGLMGHLPDASRYLSAIALATTIFNTVFWSFAFLRMGTTGLTAQAFGAGDHPETRRLLGRGMLLAALLSMVLLLVQDGLAALGFWLFSSTPEVEALARTYFEIRIWAAPAAFGMQVLSGWFLGMQNATYPMALSIIVNVLNIAFSYVCVVLWDMDVAGVAWGTVASQYVGLLLAGGLWYYRYGRVQEGRLGLADLLDRVALFRFFKVNADIMIRTMCIAFAFTFFTLQSASRGTDFLAANSLLIQLLFLMSYLVDGFAYAAEGLVGRYLGAGNRELLRQAIRGVVLWGMAFGLLFAGVYALWGADLLSLLSNDRAVTGLAREYLPWMIAMPVWGAFAFLWDGIYIGATRTVPMRNAMLVATFAFFLPAFYLTEPTWGNHALWIAMSLFMLMRGLFLALLSKKSGF